LEPTVYANPNSETLETVLKDLDNQEELTGTLVLVKDVKKQENGPVERFMVKLTQLQNLKDKPKVSYCILSQKQYYQSLVMGNTLPDEILSVEACT